MKMSCLLPRAKLQRVTFFMKRSYLLPRENFKLPYLPNQAHWDPGICSQLRSSHIHSIHQKSRDFINGNFVYLALICAVWSSRGRAGKKVTAVTFFRCPTVLCLPSEYMCMAQHYNDVKMGAISSQITSLTIVYSIVYSDADQRKHPRHWPFCGEFTWDRWIPRTNGQ